MFDIFGIRAKRAAKKKEKEAKELADAQERKKSYQERKSKIIDYLNKYSKEQTEKENMEYEKSKKEAEKQNSTCPRCGSKNVIHVIKRTKGEIHGEGSIDGCGSIAGSLFGIGGYSYSHGHSEIDGELDTLQVNKCNDCGEEWHITEPEDRHYDDSFSNYDSFKPGYLYRRIEGYYELKYDPYDVKNDCNSLEEMQEKYLKEYSNVWSFEDYRKAPRYMVEHALYKGFTEHYYNLDDLDRKLFNYHEDDDAYSYMMSDEMWDVVKKLIGWKGEE